MGIETVFRHSNSFFERCSNLRTLGGNSGYARRTEALVESALNNIKILEDENFFNFKISVKSSDVFLAIKAYRSLSSICDYPLHLGITEAGGLTSGSIKSSIGIGMLLMEGIGDTIRVS